MEKFYLVIPSPSNKVEAEKRSMFTIYMCGLLGDSISLPAATPPNPMDEYWDLEPYEDEHKTQLEIPKADLVDAAGKPFYQTSITDTLINAKALLPSEDSQAIARVVQHAVDSEGKLIGEHNDTPLLNMLQYICKFNDGLTKKYAANLIVLNIFMESDADGYSSSILYKIVDHKSSGEAVKIPDKYIVSKNGTKQIWQTTIVWKFLVQWSNGSRQWIALKVLKKSNPVQVAEYVTACNLEEEPAFAWWVSNVLRKQDVIVSAVNSWMKQTSHKYGVELPCSVSHETEIDHKNKNTFWSDNL
jgi:hypothetical protein